MHCHRNKSGLELDREVQLGAVWCISANRWVKVTKQKRFTVSLDESDYAALRELGEAQKPALNLQYMLRLAVRNLLDQQETQQLTLPLKQLRR